MQYSAALFGLALITSSAAMAGPPTPPPQEDCGANTNQTEMNICYGRELDRANVRLNAAYAKVLKGMSDDPKGVELLRSAERAWVDFREKNCSYQAHGEEGGSLYPTMVATCEIKMTDLRTKEIAEGN